MLNINMIWGRLLKRVWEKHQPPKLGVEGSNPSPPATISQIEPKNKHIYKIASAYVGQIGLGNLTLLKQPETNYDHFNVGYIYYWKWRHRLCGFQQLNRPHNSVE